MKKITLLVVLILFSTTILSADMLDELLKNKSNPIEAFHEAKKLGCSEVIVMTIYDAWDFWYEKGQKAARKDFKASGMDNCFDSYNEGLKAAEKSSERYSSVVHSRYQKLFTLACERGFRQGYYKTTQLRG